MAFQERPLALECQLGVFEGLPWTSFSSWSERGYHSAISQLVLVRQLVPLILQLELDTPTPIHRTSKDHNHHAPRSLHLIFSTDHLKIHHPEPHHFIWGLIFDVASQSRSHPSAYGMLFHAYLKWTTLTSARHDCLQDLEDVCSDGDLRLIHILRSGLLHSAQHLNFVYTFIGIKRVVDVPKVVSLR